MEEVTNLIRIAVVKKIERYVKKNTPAKTQKRQKSPCQRYDTNCWNQLACNRLRRQSVEHPAWPRLESLSFTMNKWETRKGKNKIKDCVRFYGTIIDLWILISIPRTLLYSITPQRSQNTREPWCKFIAIFISKNNKATSLIPYPRTLNS